MPYSDGLYLLKGNNFSQSSRYVTLELFSNPYRGGGPRIVVSTAAFHATVRGSVLGLDGLKETKMFSIHVSKLVLWGASVTER